MRIRKSPPGFQPGVLWHLRSLPVQGPGWKYVVPGAAKPQCWKARGMLVRASLGSCRAFRAPSPTLEALTLGMFLHLPRCSAHSSNMGQHRQPRAWLPECFGNGGSSGAGRNVEGETHTPLHKTCPSPPSPVSVTGIHQIILKQPN